MDSPEATPNPPPTNDIARRPAGRYGHEVAAGSGTEVARLRRRAERAEVALADERRHAAQAIRGLQAEVAYWRLRAQGVPAGAAATEAGLAPVPEG